MSSGFPWWVEKLCRPIFVGHSHTPWAEKPLWKQTTTLNRRGLDQSNPSHVFLKPSVMRWSLDFRRGLRCLPLWTGLGIPRGGAAAFACGESGLVVSISRFSADESQRTVCVGLLLLLLLSLLLLLLLLLLYVYKYIYIILGYIFRASKEYIFDAKKIETPSGDQRSEADIMAMGNRGFNWGFSPRVFSSDVFEQIWRL